MDFHIPFSRIFTLIQMHLHGESFYFVNGTKASNQFPSTGCYSFPQLNWLILAIYGNWHAWRKRQQCWHNKPRYRWTVMPEPHIYFMHSLIEKNKNKKLCVSIKKKKKKLRTILRKFLKNPINFLGILLIYKKNENMLLLLLLLLLLLVFFFFFSCLFTNRCVLSIKHGKCLN